MSPITTHVLDMAAGRPATGIRVVLEFFSSPTKSWATLGTGATDADGRANTLLPDDHKLQPGVYRLRFETSAVSPFYPEVPILFRITDAAQHYHVPLLLSPYGYSTYRGS
jgi:5-hydroxyisourate hydrolase